VNTEKAFSKFASRTARVTGQPITFLACVAVVLLWAISGPFFGFSETWQLVINTGTTIITFLMVFLIQNTQNRDSEAVQAKLDALVLVSDAENDFVGIEDLTDRELREMHRRCAKAAKAHTDLHQKLNAELESREADKPKLARKTASPKRPAKTKA
jgi:low affinity Fe/Cu permease